MYIDDGGGGGSVDFGSIGASMKAFASAAASGAFAISESGGQALIDAITYMQQSIEERQVDLQNLTLEPPLGTSHGAHTMRQFVPQVATDGQGFLTMLTKFHESLEDAKQGINAAIANYQALEERSASRQST